MIHAQEGTRGLLQKLLKQEECSSSAGDGLDETHTNDKVVTEKDATPASGAFSPGVLCPIARRGRAYFV